MLKHKSDMPARPLVAERIVAVAKNGNLGRNLTLGLKNVATACPLAAEIDMAAYEAAIRRAQALVAHLMRAKPCQHSC